MRYQAMAKWWAYEAAMQIDIPSPEFLGEAWKKDQKPLTPGEWAKFEEAFKAERDRMYQRLLDQHIVV